MIIYLPEKIEQELFQLTTLRQETSGVLLFQEDYSANRYIAAVYKTGTGNESSVEGDSKKVLNFLRFCKENPEYGWMEFHTHTEETIRIFGPHYAKHFSEGDLKTIEENKRKFGQNDYDELLITPEWMVYSEDSECKIATKNWELNGRLWKDVSRLVMKGLRE